MVKAVVGACWGDEGKGKITDMLAGDADIVVRFQGGANAGHTIVNEYGKFALHLLPSGSFNQNVVNMIGNGVALDIPELFKELKEIISRNVPAPKLLISERAQVLMPYHKLFDQYEEERLSDRQFGSTKSGIAPFFSDKYSKIGFQVWELFRDEELMEKIKNVLEVKNLILEHVYHKPLLDAQEIYNTCKEYAEIVKPYVVDSVQYMHKAVKEGKTILLEGQLGSLKDPDFGIYPFTTSSSPLAGYGAIGACVPPYEIKQIITVVKAYSSAVGAGAFVSEIFGDEAEELRRRGGDGGEYGVTTGRPRRVGWFDCVASRYGCRVQGTTDVAFTVLDVLGYLDEIPVCVGYEVNGEVIRDFPTTDKLDIAKPVLKVLPGWKCDIRGIRNYDELPENCRNYIEFIEKELEVPITIVSNGPAREDIIIRNKYSIFTTVSTVCLPYSSSLLYFFMISTALSSTTIGVLSFVISILRASRIFKTVTYEVPSMPFFKALTIVVCGTPILIANCRTLRYCLFISLVITSVKLFITHLTKNNFKILHHYDIIAQ